MSTTTTVFGASVADAFAATIADHGLTTAEAASQAGLSPRRLERCLSDGDLLTLSEWDALCGGLGIGVLDVLPA